ncbi:MAG TPA: Ig-like domain-containing protein [Burkholderiaceae bacterium]|nr:Ig-like domain-containing protein [Burkholderiaceae bacterium]
MKRQFKYSAMASLILATMLTACGGGGGSPAASAITLSGTAATGAPFAGADIRIFDKNNTEVGKGQSNANGSYEITLSPGATAPFVLKAMRDDLTLVSVAADSGSSTINITPITNLIASRLSTSGDPAKLAAELQANPALLAPVTVNAKVAEVVALLKPLLDAVGASANPLTGKFTADGTGLDRVLDSLVITITPSSPTTTNIEVAVKQQIANGDQPQVVQFTNSSPAPGTLPVVDPTMLVPNGTAPLIADLLQRVTACFALPVAERVNTPNPPTATATDIKAAACKTIFHNGDPATYKSGGKQVGVGLQTSFNGIFRDGGTGTVFDRGSYEFTRDNKDLVIGYRSTDKDGNVQYDTLAVRADDPAKPTRLALIGNQNDYDGSVTAYHQLREFPQSAANNYYSSGYAFSIPKVGNLQKVIVTSPTNKTFVLIAGTGLNTLTFPKHDDQSGASGASFIRLRSVYADAGNSGNPASVDTSQFFAGTPASDADLAGYPAQSTWKFDYYTGADLNNLTLAATQYHKTRARPLTIPELQTQGLASLTPTILEEIGSGMTPSGLPLDAGDQGDLAWQVPNGALAPTQLRLWGRFVADKTKNFDVAATVQSSSRAGRIACTAAGAHCDGNGNFAGGLEATGLHLWARNPVGREFAHFYAFYGFN